MSEHNHEHHNHEHHNHVHHNHNECHCHSHNHCGCSHEHHKTDKKITVLKFISVILFALSFMHSGITSYFLTIPAIILCGYQIISSGIKSFINLRFDENALILIASLSAVILGEHHEAYMVILLFSIGEFLEDYAVEKSEKTINKLIDISSDVAYSELGEKIDAESLKSGDRFLARPGDKICVDAVIESGFSSFDTSAITGETMPKDLLPGDTVLSGYINLNSSVVCKAITDYNNSTASKIKNYVQNASSNKAATEKFITRFASVYTPTVIISAIIMGICFIAFGITDIAEGVKRSLSFMIASCPCALVISIPLSYFASVGTMSKYGLLVKGTKHVNTMSEADAIAFDKTGTLTKGKLVVCDVTCSDNITKTEVLKIAKAVEIHSSHPIAAAICNSYDGEYPKVSDVKEYFGKGIKAYLDGKVITIGSGDFCISEGCRDNELINQNGTVLCIDNIPKAVIRLSDELRDDVTDTINRLKKYGIRDIYVLSGDDEKNVKETCESIENITEFGNLLPLDKANKIKEIKSTHKKTIFVGDGVNDAPSLSEADFSVSVNNGSSVALETGDAVLMSGNLKTIYECIAKAKQTRGIVYENIVISLGIKLIVILLAITGIAPIWLSVFADVGLMIITVLNSMRIIVSR